MNITTTIIPKNQNQALAVILETNFILQELQELQKS